jgi:D-beta-D-heptose 7-phosphate kinase/D-beta-D-heptose 1-phosphate adenosyltransferase
MNIHNKTIEYEKLLNKSLDRKIGLCWGGFDFLHAGHILHFKFTKKYCQTLIVAINSDQAFPDKGKGRPFFPEQERAEIIASIDYVDYVVVYHGSYLNNQNSVGILHGKIQTTPYVPIDIINKIKPDYYFKGIEYKGKSIPEIEIVQKNGGVIIYGPEEPVFSASQIIKSNNL